MLKYTFDEGGRWLEINGTLRDTEIAALCLMQMIYANIKSNNAEAAESFRAHVAKVICDENSSVWDGENRGGGICTVVDTEELLKQMEQGI